MAAKGAPADSALAPAGVSEVVTKALAFKALLTTTQQATLEQTYTTTLARRWSNLPCGSSCRNGIQFSTLTATQLAAAVEVVKAAMGTVANEGSDEFNQIRLADTYLGANGGGSGYSEGIYFLSFLNTPSATGAWMLQFGGHHYGANVAYNQGHVVGTTPQFEALEPLTFTTSGTTYAPLTQERDALAAMLAALNATQLASAKLSTTFSDTTMTPGESNGGNGTFPTTKVGIAVSTLSAAQKLLVLAAMKPWVQDMDDTVAANLLSIYQSELDGTYIAFTGSGTAGDTSSFLNANTNYARIDGPSVWIEFACQSGVVFRNQIHYHTVWRDHVRDYGKDLSLTTPLDTSAVAAVAITSAASYVSGALAPEAIGALFGTGLASGTVSASTTPLPTTLGNVQVQVKDSAGSTRNAPLFFVSPAQLNFQIPAGTATGSATVNVVLNSTTVGAGTLTVAAVAPGVFAANANGSGVAAALVLRVKADGTQTFEAATQFNTTTNRYEAVPIDLGATTEQVFLIGYGTGFRNRSSLAAATATIGGASATVSYAGAQGSLTGLDQANLLIPRSLAGRGSVEVALSVDGTAANTVTINIK
ncbi:MAG: DUF3500 domain-containing protein [Acidobacteria bacterium]|nr:DUF3500 domain-containing protein [Acidobacteriota bacterium]MBI3426470.1 DUF3500 domain-containing protein [Acidobacteriota bacterium]